MFNAQSIIARAKMFYAQLSEAGLTRASMEELGSARQANVPFHMLSVDLKRTLMRVVQNYEEGAQLLDLQESEERARTAAYLGRAPTEENPAVPVGTAPQPAAVEMADTIEPDSTADVPDEPLASNER
jgi:hypothetical protein